MCLPYVNETKLLNIKFHVLSLVGNLCGHLFMKVFSYPASDEVSSGSNSRDFKK